MPVKISSSNLARTLSFIVILSALFCLHAADAKTRHKHHKAVHHHAGVDGSASYSDIVIEADTGRILHATDPDEPRHPASLTKMMTLYLTFQALETGHLHLDQSLPVSASASEQSPSKLGLRRGQHIRVEDAILGVVTESANDAAYVLAEALGGTAPHFAEIMTRQAHMLGMNNTSFRNPNGLPDPRQVTTARDMAILGHSLVYHYAQYYPYFSTASFTYAGIPHANHNHLMERYDGMDGIKTGYIRASGFNLVASALRGDTRLIGVVFGGHSTTARDNQMALLLDQAFAKAGDEHQTRRMASETSRPNFPQGDSTADDEDSEYVTFPAKGGVPAAPAPAALRTAAAPAGGWSIQVGAYNDPAIGRQALASITQSMPQLLSRATPAVQEVSAGGVTMYRARLQGLDEKTARTACAYLAHHSQSCLTVAPEVTIPN